MTIPTITLCEIATLNHEVLDHTMKCRAFISKALLASSKNTEILRRLGHCLAVETHDNSSQGLIAMTDVKVHLDNSMSFQFANPEYNELHTFCVIFGPFAASAV